MADFEYIKNWTTEDDYVERGGVCDELTVTITLREYRGLIEERVKQAAEIERLKEERDKFEKQAHEYGKMLIARHPEIIGKITDAVSEFVGGDSEPEDDEPAEIKCPCNMRDYMTMDDCNETGCDYCCPLVAQAADACPLTGCGSEEADAE